jgi:hypothetical protein
MALIADYFDACRFGYEGVEGYRKAKLDSRLLQAKRDLPPANLALL